MESKSIEEAPKATEPLEKGTIDAGGETSQQSTNEMQEKPHEYLSGVKLLLVFGSLTLAVFLYFMDGSIVATVRELCTR